MAIARPISTILLFLCSTLIASGDASLLENFQYRQEWGDLGTPGSIQVLPGKSRRAVRLGEGSEQLLKACRENRGSWREDPLLARLAHRNPGSTVSCRERGSPSLHVVFYPKADGTQEAWAHFDLYGARNPWVHTTEVMRNVITFGRTSPYDVRRSLVQARHRMDPSAPDVLPPPRYNFGEKSRRFLWNTLGPSAVGVASFTASASWTLLNAAGRDLNPASHRERIAANLLRNALSQTIEFGAGAFLQQELRFTASGQDGFRRRTGRAISQMFVIPGRDGRELAFPRLAAAFGAPWAMRGIHPGLSRNQNPWMQSAFLMSQYAVRSYWAEFKPELQRVLHKLFRIPAGHAAIGVPELSEP